MLAAQLVEAGQLIAVLVMGAEVPGKADEVGDVPAADGGLLTRFREPFGTELTNRVKEPVPGLIFLRAQHNGLVHQPDQRRQDLRPVQGASRTDVLGPRDAE